MSFTNGHADGWQDTARAARSDQTAGAYEEFDPGTTGRETEPPTLPIIDPRGWEGQPVPAREWLVPNLIPKGHPTLISADGAAGKSTLMLQLAIARALGKSWLGQDTRPGGTLYLSAEDDEPELHRRCDAIRRHYESAFADMGGLTLVDLVGQDAVLGSLNRQANTIVPTKLYEAVGLRLRQVQADLLIVDALADAFAGVENDRQQARQFIGLMKRLCREHAVTVIIIAHPSEAGLSSGSGKSGSTAWNNSVRSRLYFRKDEGAGGQPGDPALRTLTSMKSNYGPAGGQIEVRYEAGAFVAIESATTTVDKAAREARADAKFLELLRLHISQGIRISPKASPSYAPSVFAKHIDADKLTKDDFTAAMQRHLKAERIKIDDEGPPSKRVQRLNVVEGGGP